MRSPRFAGLAALMFLSGCAGPMLAGRPGQPQPREPIPAFDGARGEPTFCIARVEGPGRQGLPNPMVWEARFRDLRLLTQERPGPAGCDVLLELGADGVTAFSNGWLKAYSAYSLEPLWEGRCGLGGLKSLAVALQKDFQPGQPAFQSLAESKAKGGSPTIRDVEDLARGQMASEAYFEHWTGWGHRFGAARTDGAEAAGTASAEPPSPPAGARASDVDEVPARRASRRGHAVIVGIERYRGALPKAKFAAADAALMAKYAARVLGYPEADVALLTDEGASKGDFEKYFERWLPNRVKPGDEVFVYFSGHGAPNPKTGDAFLVPYDGDPAYLQETAYPVKRLYAALAKLPAGKVTVALDSCFSGAGGRSVIAEGARPLVTVAAAQAPAGVTVIAASGPDQISNTYLEKGHGLFTYFLLKGLQENGPNLRAAFDYLRPEVATIARRQYNSDQDPQWREGR